MSSSYLTSSFCLSSFLQLILACRQKTPRPYKEGILSSVHHTGEYAVYQSTTDKDLCMSLEVDYIVKSIFFVERNYLKSFSYFNESNTWLN